MLQDGELLDALGVGGGSLVDACDALLNGGVHQAVASAGDVRDARATAAQLTAVLQRLWGQLVLWGARLWVHLTLTHTHTQAH